MSFGPTPKYERVRNYKRRQEQFTIISGPCSVESREQILSLAKTVKNCGATHLRGGVFRAGTYPNDSVQFGWISEHLIQSFHEAAVTNGMKNIIEVLDYSDESFKLIEPYAECFQVGARAMQNYTLLSKLGKYKKPVFLKRGVGNTLNEWLGAAEYLLRSGVEELYLIERGSSTFLNHVRWDLSISMIPAVKAITEIPVIVDASHGTGRRDLVSPMTLAGVAAGAAGCLVECHYDPDNSLSDKEQAITPNELAILLSRVKNVRSILY